ncbi:ABC transporter ATP-binding protein [Bosea sp. RAF48]|uniref:ABC transporter ATP-binding protein n=1 Tax=Bosea sp. RAF48 TaxID=3237480 RepID=UPI003F8DAE12
MTSLADERQAPSASLEQSGTRHQSAPALISIENLRIQFPPWNAPVRIVEDVSYQVHAGETMGIVGESGSGKTLSSLAILNLLPPPARIAGGRILFEGQDLAAKSQQEMQKLRGRRLAMIFQNPGYSLNPLLTVGAQLAEILKVHEKLPRAVALQRVEELFRLVGITDPGSRLSQYPHEMSGGMKQRVCIARALLCNPALVLADEPTTALDVTIQAQILDLLEELKQRLGMSMIFVTHDMGVVARIADRITVMYAGQVCETGDKHAVFARPSHPYTQALLASTPRIDRPYAVNAQGRRERLPTVGRAATPGQPLTGGCRFAGRCPEAQPECSRLVPQAAAIEPGRVVHCLERGSAGVPDHG